MWWFLTTAVSTLPLHSGKNTQASPTVSLRGHYPEWLKHWNAWSGILSPWKIHPEYSTNNWDNESANKPGSYYFTQKSKAIESWQFSLNPCIPWDHTLGKKCTMKTYNENPPENMKIQVWLDPRQHVTCLRYLNENKTLGSFQKKKMQLQPLNT